MKRILFVDDEPAVLDGLRAMLRKRRAEWQMEFVPSGIAALHALESQRFDLVCSDIRMPEIDGAQLLTAISERWPETVRIALSGHLELVQTMRLVPIAHQYLSKPCSAELLQNTLERCLRVQELLTQPALRALVGRVRKLPALPRTYAKLRQAMGRPNVSASEVAQIVSSDMVVAAKVLQVVNSAFFRLARRISRIEQAVTYLGFAAVGNLVMSTEVFSQWNKTSPIPGLDLETMQAKALIAAATARTLAAGTQFVDDAMVAGLLHDIGYMILIEECPNELRHAQREADEQRIPLYQAERRIIGTSHAEIGAYLLALWGLPYSIVEAVAHHHEPSSVSHTEFDILGALVVAAYLTHEQDPIHGQRGTGPQLDAGYLQTIHAPFSWERARECVQLLKTTGGPL
jgi:putative nucleotidyltransferase with HDIG domain